MSDSFIYNFTCGMGDTILFNNFFTKFIMDVVLDKWKLVILLTLLTFLILRIMQNCHILK